MKKMTKELRSRALEIARDKSCALPDGDLDLYEEENDVYSCDGGIRVNASVWIADWELGIDEDGEDE